jgi:hypothetical protein
MKEKEVSKGLDLHKIMNVVKDCEIKQFNLLHQGKRRVLITLYSK